MKPIAATAVLLALLFCAVSSGGDTELDKKIDELFIQASNPEAHHQDLVEPARVQLAEMGELAVPRLVSKLASDDAREGHALADIFKRIGSPAVPGLIGALETDDLYGLRNAARCLGEIGDKSATAALIRLFAHKDHTVRSAAVTSVGQCRDSSAVEDCMMLLSDSVEPVRKSAAVALGRIGDPRAVSRLIDALADPHFSVRMSAASSLTAVGEPACEAVVHRYDGMSDVARYLAFEVWAGCRYAPAKKLLERATYSSDKYARAFSVYALAAVDEKAARKRIKRMIREETDLLVLSRIRAAEVLLDSAAE